MSWSMLAIAIFGICLAVAPIVIAYLAQLRLRQVQTDLAGAKYELRVMVDRHGSLRREPKSPKMPAHLPLADPLSPKRGASNKTTDGSGPRKARPGGVVKPVPAKPRTPSLGEVHSRSASTGDFRVSTEVSPDERLGGQHAWQDRAARPPNAGHDHVNSHGRSWPRPDRPRPPSLPLDPWEVAATVEAFVVACAEAVDEERARCEDYIRDSSALGRLVWRTPSRAGHTTNPMARFLPPDRHQMIVVTDEIEAQDGERRVMISLSPVCGLEKAALRPAFGSLVSAEPPDAGISARVASIREPCVMIVPERRWREAQEELHDGTSRTSFVNLHVDAEAYRACRVRVES